MSEWQTNKYKGKRDARRDMYVDRTTELNLIETLNSIKQKWRWDWTTQ